MVESLVQGLSVVESNHCLPFYWPAIIQRVKYFVASKERQGRWCTDTRHHGRHQNADSIKLKRDKIHI